MGMRPNMARSPTEEPEGILYRPDLLSAGEEEGVLSRFETLRFDPIVIRGQAARRTARHYGLNYDYEARTPTPGEPMPDWLQPPRTLPPPFPDAPPHQSTA